MNNSDLPRLGQGGGAASRSRNRAAPVLAGKPEGAPVGRPQRNISSQVAIAAAWRARADELAVWTMRTLVARDDVYGQYLLETERTAGRKAVTRRGEISLELLRKHYRAEQTGDLIGLHTTSANQRCRWIAINIDHHGSRDDAIHRACRSAAITLYGQLQRLGVDALLTSSDGRGGYHLRVLFEPSLPSTTAYRFAKWFVRDWAKLGLSNEPETFPRQPRLTAKRPYGNWLRLPGRHQTLQHYSQVWNGAKWLCGNEAIDAILRTKPTSPQKILRAALCYVIPEPEPQSPPCDVGPYLTQEQTRSPIGAILPKLANIQLCGNGWSARCPAHNDHNNSLSIHEVHDKKVLVCCHAGCDFAEIAEALGIGMTAFFPRGRMMSRAKRKAPIEYRPWRNQA